MDDAARADNCVVAVAVAVAVEVDVGIDVGIDGDAADSPSVYGNDCDLGYCDDEHEACHEHALYHPETKAFETSLGCDD